MLEDRLARADDAVVCYREALAAAPEHPGALLSLLLAGAQRQDPAMCAEALGGLARRAESPTARAALVIEEALAWRRSQVPNGADRALVVLEEELGRNDAGAPLGALLVELEALARADVPAATAARALDDLAKRVGQVDAGLAVALLRERARLLRQELAAPEAALEALDEASRLDPTHPLVAAERLELALALDRRDAAGEIARAFLLAAEREDEAVDFALLYVEAIFDPRSPDAALEILQTPRVQACRPARADLRALELALAVVRRDPAALADAFAGGADAETHADSGSKVAALVAAAAIRAGALGQTDVATDLYRRAIDMPASPALARPALQALVSLQAAAGRIEEATAILESALAVPSSSSTLKRVRAKTPPSKRGPANRWWRSMPMSWVRPAAHCRTSADWWPCSRKTARAGCGSAISISAAAPHGLRPGDRADNLLALAAGAADPAVEVALRVMAGRALADSPEPSAGRPGAGAARRSGGRRSLGAGGGPAGTGGGVADGAGGDCRGRAGVRAPRTAGGAHPGAPFPSGPPPRGGGRFRRGDGRVDPASLRGRSAGARLELRAGPSRG